MDSTQVLYVVKQKCTTANIVIYSDISLLYYFSYLFNFLPLPKYTSLGVRLSNDS